MDRSDWTSEVDWRGPFARRVLFSRCSQEVPFYMVMFALVRVVLKRQAGGIGPTTYLYFQP